MTTQERAEKILGNSRIATLFEEVKNIKILQDIASKEITDEEDIKTLDKIEKYLTEKEIRITKEDDLKYLKNLSKDLKLQKVRLGDKTNPVLFSIKDIYGKEVFFITRKELDKYRECNKDEQNKVIEISENKSYEILKLLEVIERNF